MPDQTLRDQVVDVLAGQAPGYYAYPNAAAFSAVGLDPVDVADMLTQLESEGSVEREVVTQIEKSSDQVYLELSVEEREALTAMPPPVLTTIPGGYHLAT